MKLLKFIPKILLAALLLYILSININLYHQPTFKSYEGEKLNKGVIPQVNLRVESVGRFIYFHWLFLGWLDFGGIGGGGKS